MCGPGQRIPASGPNSVTTSRPGRRTRAGAEPFSQEPIPGTRPRHPLPTRFGHIARSGDRGSRGPFHPCRSASPNPFRLVRRFQPSGPSIRPDSRQLRMRMVSAPHAAYPHRKSHHRPHAPLRLLPPANCPHIRRPARSLSPPATVPASHTYGARSGSDPGPPHSPYSLRSVLSLFRLFFPPSPPRVSLSENNFHWKFVLSENKIYLCIVIDREQ